MDTLTFFPYYTTLEVEVTTNNAFLKIVETLLRIVPILHVQHFLFQWAANFQGCFQAKYLHKEYFQPRLWILSL